MPKKAAKKEIYTFSASESLITIINYQGLSGNDFELTATKLEILRSSVDGYNLKKDTVLVLSDTFTGEHGQAELEIDAEDYELTTDEIRSFATISRKRWIKL